MERGNFCVIRDNTLWVLSTVKPQVTVEALQHGRDKALAEAIRLRDRKATAEMSDFKIAKNI